MLKKKRITLDFSNRKVHSERECIDTLLCLPFWKLHQINEKKQLETRKNGVLTISLTYNNTCKGRFKIKDVVQAYLQKLHQLQKACPGLNMD